MDNDKDKEIETLKERISIYQKVVQERDTLLKDLADYFYGNNYAIFREISVDSLFGRWGRIVDATTVETDSFIPARVIPYTEHLTRNFCLAIECLECNEIWKFTDYSIDRHYQLESNVNEHNMEFHNMQCRYCGYSYEEHNESLECVDSVIRRGS